jgi:hypothetical protein
VFYVLINCNGIEVQESEKMLSLEEMQNLVGVEGEKASIEVASYRSFSDKSITMICDDEFLTKEYQPTCLTVERDVICGQVLILGTNSEENDFDLLSKEQVEIVKSQARLVRVKFKRVQNPSLPLLRTLF